MMGGAVRAGAVAALAGLSCAEAVIGACFCANF
jgi:hypothetical protein